MSQLFEGFSRARIQPSQPVAVPLDMAQLVPAEPAETTGVPSDALPGVGGLGGAVDVKKALDSEKSRSVMVQPPTTSRLVAWIDPNSLGAEKFRALSVRLDAIRRHEELK